MKKQIQLNLSKEDYKKLLKLLYLGEWMVNSSRTGRKGDEDVKDFEKLEQYVWSFAKELGLGHWIMKDEDGHYLTMDFESSPDIDEYREHYDNYTFWEELLYRIAEKDLIQQYGQDEISKMGPEERMMKERAILEKYDKEFTQYGINNLRIHGD